ncbi:porin [Luteimonas sp. R10]|uniref:porin n=1 Tax=Luteimonas sp. R10 TaxID=3108176 RepID=UPI0030918EF0|nr:porin [Luteimonas sp. R10]
MRMLFASRPAHLRRAGTYSAVATALLAACTTAAAQEAPLRVYGYVHYDLRDFSDDGSGSGAGSSEVRRVRPIFAYRRDSWSLRFMPDLQRNRNQVLDAYLDLTPGARWNLRIGRFKSPLSIDRLKSINAAAMVENSVVSEMTPNRDNGVLLGIDMLPDDALRIELGVFDGAADGEVKGAVDHGMEAMLRLVATTAVGGARLRYGGGLSGGHREGAVGDARLGQYRTSGRAVWFRPAADAYADGDTARSVLFADAYDGAWHGQVEWARSEATVRADAASKTLAHRGWEVQLGRVLTGEDRDFARVVPARLTIPGAGIPVAIELTGRYGEMRIDPDAFPIFADPADSGSRLRVRGLSLGLWFPKEWRLTFDYEDSRVDLAADGRLHERVLLTRAAITF